LQATLKLAKPIPTVELTAVASYIICWLCCSLIMATQSWVWIIFRVHCEAVAQTTLCTHPQQRRAGGQAKWACTIGQWSEDLGWPC